ncbi:MAG: hypothetical protein JO089_06775, partial [Alphaproteobacteria bacterium]|nr:hypothetical protein [Alphaproteobacteria bacterium]
MAKLNATTFQRTESKAIPVVNPVVADPGKIAIAVDKPEKIWLILLPYLDNQHDIEKLFKDYALQSDHVFNDDGYELQVLELRKKIVEGN